MNLENVNKKTLLVILMGVILLIIGIPYILSFILWLMFLLFFGMPNALSVVVLLMLFIVVLKFFKGDKIAKKEIIKRYFLNIYWKKNLLFLFYFIIVDIIFPSIIVSFDSVGYPLPYFNYNFLGYSLLFRSAFFIFDILFWYTMFGLIVKQPIKINKNVVKLNYITLAIVLLVMSYYLLPLISKSQIVII